MGPQPLPPKGHSPQFSANICCGQMAGCHLVGRQASTQATLYYTETQLPLPKKGADLQFSSHVYCGQTAGWIKMPLGTEVNLGPGVVVLDGVAATPSLKGTHPPVFGSGLLWPNSWMDEDATWYGSRPRPRPHCARRGPSSSRERGTAAQPPLFGPCLL